MMAMMVRCSVLFSEQNRKGRGSIIHPDWDVLSKRYAMRSECESQEKEIQKRKKWRHYKGICHTKENKKKKQRAQRNMQMVCGSVWLYAAHSFFWLSFRTGWAGGIFLPSRRPTGVIKSPKGVFFSIEGETGPETVAVTNCIRHSVWDWIGREVKVRDRGREEGCVWLSQRHRGRDERGDRIDMNREIEIYTRLQDDNKTWLKEGFIVRLGKIGREKEAERKIASMEKSALTIVIIRWRNKDGAMGECRWFVMSLGQLSCKSATDERGRRVWGTGMSWGWQTEGERGDGLCEQGDWLSMWVNKNGWLFCTEGEFMGKDDSFFFIIIIQREPRISRGETDTQQQL